MQALISFATRYPRTYLVLCFAGGLLIRWYWCGQDLNRWLNPLAPLFA